ncbi:MAG: glycoside hydrolase family 97 protein [Prevotellaceae bacterium]|jgi:alpha-glucosidase|nr:glycoside hydrolase family 97 protein [Prevotellaceae bacterium]
MLRTSIIGVLLIAMLPCVSVGAAEAVEVTSPDGRLTLSLSMGKAITYSVSYKGKEVVAPSAIGLTVGGKFFWAQPKVKKVLPRSVNQTITPLYGKFATLQDSFNEKRVELDGSYAITVRAYNEGVAYRFATAIKGMVTVESETAEFNLAGEPEVTFPETNTLTSWEVPYLKYQTPAAIDEGKRAITPTLFSYPDAGRLRVVVAEADVRSYPGMYLERTKGGFRGYYAPYPDSIAMGSWGNFVTVVQRQASYIAKTEGTREYPWRVIIATDDDRALLTNELIYKLSTPQAIADASWVKPGKAAWEWWHDAELPGDSVPSGMKNRSTALYKRYVDFAAENGIEYLMWDAGWSDIFDLSKVNPKTDVQEVIRYAKSKNVGVFLWCVAAALRENADTYMDLLRSWGAVGLKVDFFDRDDQQALDWLEAIARKAAEHKLMVDFHGCGKPTGLQRMYPNILNFEAVRGAECAKWDLTPNPVHHLTFPFTRMLGGSLDYTPGSMRNRTQQSFKPLDPGMPLTMGTRCHELAMYVVYDQYFAMLCDSPAEYNKYPDVRKFLADVPVAFDDTRVLAARVGEYAVVAKQKDGKWYVGGMTDWTARVVEVDFSFLEAGAQYTAEIFTDGYEANQDAERYNHETITLTSSTKLKVKMAVGGGFVMEIKN